MTEAVIETLEMVDVDHDHADGRLVPACSAQLALQGLFQVAPVKQAGQRVANRLLPQ